ncbi:MAG: hypothetical protein D6770_05620 [Anaerolineae bacterium]|nr:MAG: hypothetical protein D6770_05620 [Anaerolineae bacterium]
MFESALSRETQSNLAAIGQTPLAAAFYLAGGTAVALHLGHRFSFDLDFFSEKHFNVDEVLTTLKSLGEVKTFQATADTFNGELNGVRISFFLYPYPVLDAFSLFSGVQIATLRDLAAMKVDAITRRGTKRDFIDLYFICRRSFSLQEAMEYYFMKFRAFNISEIHVYKSLVYFADAEDDTHPQMIQPVRWDDVKAFFQQEVPRLYRQRFGGDGDGSF